MVEKLAQRFVKIYIMGKEYEVPEGITIMKAVEYAGYQYIRGAGCRGGFCGACATIYRLKGDYRLYTALACQTTVKDGMYLVLCILKLLDALLVMHVQKLVHKNCKLWMLYR